MLGRLKHRLLKLLEYLCTLNTLPTRVQSLDRINWEIKSPLAQRSGAKKPRESQNAPLYPQSSSFILQEGGRINFFVYFVQDCACVVVNPCVSRKYINQPSAKSSLILFKLHTPEWEHAHRTGYFIMKVVQQGL